MNKTFADFAGDVQAGHPLPTGNIPLENYSFGTGNIARGALARLTYVKGKAHTEGENVVDNYYKPLPGTPSPAPKNDVTAKATATGHNQRAAQLHATNTLKPGGFA
ncbi:MAG TPA: hypothetical protein VHB73_04930 [Alphaproteobacteria bacterium]|nr:hypothetical protein [Alphaproteobacteria bacterium]